jgi:hypothetical protein
LTFHYIGLAMNINILFHCSYLPCDDLDEMCTYQNCAVFWYGMELTSNIMMRKRQDITFPKIRLNGYDLVTINGFFCMMLNCVW